MLEEFCRCNIQGVCCCKGSTRVSRFSSGGFSFGFRHSEFLAVMRAPIWVLSGFYKGSRIWVEGLRFKAFGAGFWGLGYGLGCRCCFFDV